MTTFTIPGIPVAKARARVLKTGRSYTPEKTANFQALVRLCAAQAKVPMHEGPVRVTVWAYWPALKKHKGRTSPTWKTSRPDGDNILKNILDSGNGIIYTDDAQVVHATVAKMYAPPGEEARTEVTIEQERDV